MNLGFEDTLRSGRAESMPPLIRRAILRVVDDCDPRYVCPQLYFLFQHMPTPMLARALSWLIENRLTGTCFKDFFIHDCRASNLHLQEILTAKIRREKPLRLIAGKDFVP